MFTASTGIQNYTGITWPYPVDYDKINRIDTDFLVIGGGLAGCAAAIEAARRGLKVAVVDKGPVIRSGSAGTGIDHWYDVDTNPASTVDPVEHVDWYYKTPYWGGKYSLGFANYIRCVEAYDTWLELEKLGMNIRDDGEFEDAPFTDPKTGLMFAFDYGSCNNGRMKGGPHLKPLMKAEVDRLGVECFEYIIVAHLLTKDGKTGPEGTKVIGAMGFSGRTGECYVFRAKAVLVSCGIPSGMWCHSTELNGNSSKFLDPNNVGEGQTLLAEVGAKITDCEHSFLTCANGGLRWPMYGTGDCNNTWYGCPIVDAEGKKIPWTQNNKIVPDEKIHENVFPALGDGGPATAGGLVELPQDLPERIMKGEFKLPFYADTTALSPEERRVLWGLMIGNEGKTNYPVYKVYTANGFDPDVDMLQIPVMMPESYNPRRSKPFWNGEVYSPWREVNHVSCFAISDWRLMTTVDGLFVAGMTSGTYFASGAYASGRYAGRNATKYIKEKNEPLYPVDEEQLAKWREQVYAPVKREGGMGWKEFKAGCARVMQGNCGMYLSDLILQNGLDWFETIENSEYQRLWARNPHELMRTQECYTQMLMSKITLNACLARKCTSDELGFYRLDYPEKDVGENEYRVTVHMEGDKIVTDRMPLRYYLMPPYAPTLEENYKKYAAFDA